MGIGLLKVMTHFNIAGVQKVERKGFTFAGEPIAPQQEAHKSIHALRRANSMEMAGAVRVWSSKLAGGFAMNLQAQLRRLQLVHPSGRGFLHRLAFTSLQSLLGLIWPLQPSQ